MDLLAEALREDFPEFPEGRFELVVELVEGLPDETRLRYFLSYALSLYALTCAFLMKGYIFGYGPHHIPYKRC